MCSRVTIILVCYFLVIFIYIYIFFKRGGAFSDGGRKVGWEQVISVSWVSTVHGVCTLSAVLCKPEGIHKTARRVQTPCTVETHGTDDLCYSAPLIAL